ncbi:MAG: cupin domain-containing protein [Pseudomonadota bacterium]
MKYLESILDPMPVNELQTHYDERKCLVLEGEKTKFHDLVSPEDIELRLNDGCNNSSFAQIIKDGGRSAAVESSCVWSPASLKKTHFTESLKANLSFMMANSSQITSTMAQLIDEIEQFFGDDQVHADVHLYCSVNDRGNSYNAHRDFPQHKILLQAYGDTNWKIYNAIKEVPPHIAAIPVEEEEDWLELASEFTLTQGDLLYMPPGTFHKVVSVAGPRISISIPFYSMPEAGRMDRSHIPFASLFRDNLAAE